MILNQDCTEIFCFLRWQALGVIAEYFTSFSVHIAYTLSDSY
jgi:hypothetical protein